MKFCKPKWVDRKWFGEFVKFIMIMWKFEAVSHVPYVWREFLSNVGVTPSF